MATWETRYCPTCDEETDHRLVASMRLHLGHKRKWRCDDCDRQTVYVDGAVGPN